MHIQGGGYKRGQGMVVLSSIRRGWFQPYYRPEPMYAFNLPMANMETDGDPIELTWQELVDYVQARHYLWFTIRVYKNYDGELDAHIKWFDDERLYHFILNMPPIEADPEAETIENEDQNYGPYPAPQQWYYATGMRFVAAIGDYGGVD